MDAIKAYIQKTELMLEILKTTSVHKERAQIIDQINQAISDREKLTKEITPPFSEKEEMLGQHAIALDQQLNEQLQSLFQHIKTDMKNTKQQQRSNKTYLNPYQHVAGYDGKFLDSKK